MPINSDSMDTRRQQRASEAGHILYSSLNDHQTHRVRQQNGRPPRMDEDVDRCSRFCGDNGRISPVRRTFCLVALFDLILSFILWVIYTQIARGTNIADSLKQEIVQYNFSSSLFDTVVLAFWRFVVLIGSYAIILSKKPWMVAITTTGTCIFLLLKVFFYKFKNDNSSDTAIDYLLLLVSFVIGWVEAWMIDFKVLPIEKKARQRAEAVNNSVNPQPTERTPLLAGNSYQPRDQYYSPVDTPADSDTEDTPSDAFHSVPGTRTHSRAGSVALSLGTQEQEFIAQIREALGTSLSLLAEEDGWKSESVEPSLGAEVATKFTKDIGKIFRLKGNLNTSAKKAFNEVYFNMESSPQWNPTVLEIRALQVIDDHTQISYQVAAEAAGGMVTARDFVNVVCWEARDDCYVTASVAVTHPDMPEQKKYVRGENGPTCLVFRPIDAGSCEMTWLLNTNLKGWLPQYLIDQSLSGVMIQFLKALTVRFKDLEEITATV